MSAKQKRSLLAGASPWRPALRGGDGAVRAASCSRLHTCILHSKRHSHLKKQGEQNALWPLLWMRRWWGFSNRSANAALFRRNLCLSVIIISSFHTHTSTELWCEKGVIMMILKWWHCPPNQWAQSYCSVHKQRESSPTCYWCIKHHRLESDL